MAILDASFTILSAIIIVLSVYVIMTVYNVILNDDIECNVFDSNSVLKSNAYEIEVPSTSDGSEECCIVPDEDDVVPVPMFSEEDIHSFNPTIAPQIITNMIFR